MPITRKQFELGIIDAKIEEWMDRIYNLVVTSKEEAFTLEELHERLDPSGLKELRKKVEELRREELRRKTYHWPAYGYERDGAPSKTALERLEGEEKAFTSALDKLVNIAAVERRKIQGKFYFSYGANPFPI